MFRILSSSNSVVALAVYDTQGWHSSTIVFSPPSNTFEPRVAYNGARALMTWLEVYDDSRPGVQWVQRLTGSSEKFAAPRASCNIDLLPDGTVIAACGVEGDAVAGCFEGGPREVHAHYIETYRRPLSGEWSAPTIVSDRGKRVMDQFTHLHTNGKGDAFLVWYSDTPCQGNSQGYLSRHYSPVWSFWEPEEAFAPANFVLADFAVDRRGSLRALLLDTDISQWPQKVTRLSTKEFRVYGKGRRSPMSRKCTEFFLSGPRIQPYRCRHSSPTGEAPHRGHPTRLPVRENDSMIPANCPVCENDRSRPKPKFPARAAELSCAGISAITNCPNAGCSIGSRLLKRFGMSRRGEGIPEYRILNTKKSEDRACKFVRKDTLSASNRHATCTDRSGDRDRGRGPGHCYSGISH